MKKWNSIVRNITLISQFGLSLVIPLLMCLGICWLICDKTGVGAWIYIFGFIFGIGSSFMTAYKFYLAQLNKQEKEEKPKVSFNRH